MTAKGEERRADLPARLMIMAFSATLGVVALVGLAGIVGIVKVLIATNTLMGPWNWRIPCFLALDVLVGLGAIWGVWRLKPWKGWTAAGEPVSPSTRRTNRLFGLKELLGLLAVLALFFGAKDPIRVFSNSPLLPGVAIFAIACWLLARALREWWGRSADEHEQRAIDFGRRVGAGVFLAAAPAWWVAARAGLAPQPNVMVLWIVTMLATSIGWSWHRYR